MMFRAITILALTVTFALALASFAWEDLLTGFILSSLLVALFGRHLFPVHKPDNEFVVHITLRIPVMIGMLVADILKGTWQVALYVLGLKKLEHPGIVKIPLGNHSDQAIGFVGHLVTISPGSFVVDFDWTDRTMLVHYIDASNPDKLRGDVEKYYRLWEYGSHVPEPRTDVDLNDLDLDEGDL